MRALLCLVNLGLISLLSFSAQAAPVLTTSGFDQNIEGIKIAKTATFTMGSYTQTLSLVGAGLRAKKIVFVPVRVYVGELFVQDPASFKKTESEALGSLKSQKAVAIHMTFLHEVDAKKFLNSFKDGFKANKIDQEDLSIKKILDLIAQGGDAKKESSLAVIGYVKDDKTETIVYQNTKGDITEVNGPAGLREKVFSLWLGKSDDSGVLEFKKELLK